MAEPPPGPERINLAQVDDLRDVVHRAVACLAQGGVVGLPTETGYAFASCALYPDAVERLLALAAPEEARFPTILLRNPQEVIDWVPSLTEIGSRVIRRAWPGPICLSFPIEEGHGLASRLPKPVRDAVIRGNAIVLRVPNEGLLFEALRLSPGPIVALDILRRDDPRGTRNIARPDSENLDLIVEDGRTPEDSLPTVVRVDHDGCRVVRAGVVPEAEIAMMAGTIWLFVCTGNTCRSPMAEALCKVMLAKRLGCRVDQLVDHGYVVASAGVSASEGMPAASHAIDVIASRGGSLDRHASRRATDSLIRGADLIIALAGEHLDVLLDLAPDIADRARLLHPQGFDVLDPIGSDRATYQQTASEIEEHLAYLLDELGI